MRTFKIPLLATASVALLLLGTAGASAGPLKWGVRGGWNFDSISEIDTGSTSLASFDAATGYNFGVFADAGLGPLRVRPGITYIKTGSVFDGSTLFAESFDLGYVVFPVDAVMALPVPVISPFLATGPEFRVLASKGGAPDEFQDQLKDVGMTWGIGLGFELGAPGSPARFLPEVHYSFDLSSVTEKEYQIGSTTVTSDGKLTSWRVSLGLMF